MAKSIDQCTEINNFFNNYAILQHSEESTVIASQSHTFLIRNIQIQAASDKQRHQKFNQIVSTLSEHQQFASKNIMRLLDFQIIPSQNNNQNYIRAIYQYGQKTLAKQIQFRKQSDEYFQEDALWGLLYSIVTPLSFLEEQNVIYGVIDSSRIFLDKNIAIVDPSCAAIDPYQITSSRLFSPQLLTEDRQIEDINMFKSDVFVLGLVMLQAALLKFQLHEYDQNVIKICMNEIEDIYSERFCQLIGFMLTFEPMQRPSFETILKNLTEVFEISAIDNQDSTISLNPDKQNSVNNKDDIEQSMQREVFDILDVQSTKQQYEEIPLMTDYEKAKYKFCYVAPMSQQYTETSISQNMEQSRNTSFFIEEMMIKSIQKNKKTSKAKQIKDKLIKNEANSQTESDQIPTAEKAKHKRSKTHWEEINQNSFKQKNKDRSFHFQKESSQFKQQIKENRPIVNKENISMELNKQNLFTKPQIMNMIKNDIKRIQEGRRKNGIPINFNYLDSINQQQRVNVHTKSLGSEHYFSNLHQQYQQQNASKDK